MESMGFYSSKEVITHKPTHIVLDARKGIQITELLQYFLDGFVRLGRDNGDELFYRYPLYVGSAEG